MTEVTWFSHQSPPDSQGCVKPRFWGAQRFWLSDNRLVMNRGFNSDVAKIVFPHPFQPYHKSRQITAAQPSPFDVSSPIPESC